MCYANSMVQEQDGKPGVERMLWWMIFAGVLFYLPITWIFHQSLELPDESQSTWIALGVLAIVALSDLCLVVFADLIFAKRIPQYIVYCLLRWLLAQSICVPGFVAILQGAPMWTMPGFVLLSGIAMAKSFPTALDRKKHARFHGN